MKRSLILFLLLASITANAKNFVAKSEWDRPLETHVKVGMPTLSLTTITIIDAYNVVVRIIFSGPDPVRTWRCLMEAHAYQWITNRLESVYFHWEFDMPPTYDVYDYYVTFPYPTSWATWGASPEAVWDEEFAVYEMFPID